MLVYKKTFLSLFPFCCVNNTVHVYCAVYTVTPAPLPPPSARHGLFFNAAGLVWHVHGHRSMSRNWRTIVMQAMLIKLFLRPC